MSSAEKDQPASLLGIGSANGMAIPGIDLRALALAAAAASPFFAWNLADRLSDPYRLDNSVAAIAVDQMQLVPLHSDFDRLPEGAVA